MRILTNKVGLVMCSLTSECRCRVDSMEFLCNFGYKIRISWDSARMYILCCAALYHFSFLFVN